MNPFLDPIEEARLTAFLEKRGEQDPDGRYALYWTSPPDIRTPNEISARYATDLELTEAWGYGEYYSIRKLWRGKWISISTAPQDPPLPAKQTQTLPAV
jgi:hypothetical protein